MPALGTAALLAAVFLVALANGANDNPKGFGALVGAGLVSVGPRHLVWSALVAKFVVPLLLSPVLACLATVAMYPLVRGVLAALGLERKFCVCIETVEQPVVLRDGTLALAT